MLSPERSIEMQTAIGSDIMMVLDECIDSTADEAGDARRDGADAPLGAAQPGGAHQPGAGAVRHRAGRLVPDAAARVGGLSHAHPFDGFAIGGLAVGDTRAEREEMTAFAAELLPPDAPRYLMGVGTPPDLLHGHAAGWTCSTA